MPKSAARPHTDIEGWSVRAARCATCPFRPGGDPELANRIRAGMFEGSQICPPPRLHGQPETQLCRGARDEQLTVLHRLGLLETATDACFAEASRTPKASGKAGRP